MSNPRNPGEPMDALAGILQGLSKIAQGAADAIKQIGASGGELKVRRGFSARTLDGSPLADLGELAKRLGAFGQAVAAEPDRELLVEVLQEDSFTSVLIHAVGLDPDALHVEVVEDMVQLSLQAPSVRYIGEALLSFNPQRAPERSATDGVICLRFTSP